LFFEEARGPEGVIMVCNKSALSSIAAILRAKESKVRECQSEKGFESFQASFETVETIFRSEEGAETNSMSPI
jgi:hypothetical protein